MTKDEVLQTQIALNKKGYKLDEDGYWGTKTDAAYKDYLAKKKAKPNLTEVLSWLPILINLSQGKLNMNKDQFINLVQTLVNVGSGLAVSWGLLDQNTWVAVGAAVVAIATYVYTHYWNKTA